jgi:hypothetical protein
MKAADVPELREAVCHLYCFQKVSTTLDGFLGAF